LEDLSRAFDFTAREAFLCIWATGEFEFVFFTPSVTTNVHKALSASRQALGNSKDVYLGGEVPLGEENFVQFMQDLSTHQL
jgi:hypothetical protein